MSNRNRKIPIALFVKSDQLLYCIRRHASVSTGEYSAATDYDWVHYITCQTGECRLSLVFHIASAKFNTSVL